MPLLGLVAVIIQRGSTSLVGDPQLKNLDSNSHSNDGLDGCADGLRLVGQPSDSRNGGPSAEPGGRRTKGCCCCSRGTGPRCGRRRSAAGGGCCCRRSCLDAAELPLSRVTSTACRPAASPAGSASLSRGDTRPARAPARPVNSTQQGVTSPTRAASALRRSAMTRKPLSCTGALLGPQARHPWMLRLARRPCREAGSALQRNRCFGARRELNPRSPSQLMTGQLSTQYRPG